MMRILRTIALCAAACLALAPNLAAEGKAAERFSLAFEATGLAYGLAAGSPRICVSTNVPLSGPWSIQASPAAAWGGDAGARYFELDLPIAIRASMRLGPFSPYAAAGIELGWARFDPSTNFLATGPLAEIGARLGLFGTAAFAEAYLGGAARTGGGSGQDISLEPSIFGGLRLGYSF
jgi:hypothetical protein